MAKTLLVGQSGGATAVINASLAGVIAGARAAGFNHILGMRHAIAGLLDDALLDLTDLPDSTLDRLRRTPSAALGTGRHKLTDATLDRALARIRALDARAVVYIGGNDSADTAHRLHVSAVAAGYDLSVVAVPKTIDNDLPETDHCPGYGSIARYLGNAVRDATYDTLAAPRLYPVKFIEVMGRDAGWVAAACALGFGPDETDLLPLLSLPERPPPDAEAILAAIEERVKATGWVVAVIPETLRDAAGRHLGGDTPEYVDQFGHPYYPSPAATLTRLVAERLGYRARYDRPGTAARMSISLASSVDLDEAERLGADAARRAASGASDVMTALARVSDAPYRCEVTTVPLAAVANRVRPLPDTFIGRDAHAVTAAFRAYALPLLGPAPFPPYIRL